MKLAVPVIGAVMFCALWFTGVYLAGKSLGLGATVKCHVSEINRGITESELRALCGDPIHINADDSVKQWVYRGPESLYVYTSNGRVRSMQWQEH